MHTRLRPRILAVVTAVLLTGAAGCDIDDILGVDDPDIVPPDELTGEVGATARRNGAIGDFALAYAGDGIEGQILVSGMFTDEFVHSGTFRSRQEYDARDVAEDNLTATIVFQNLSRARQASESAARALIDVSEGEPDARIGEMWNLAGYTYVLFGENYCSGVPYSELDGGDIVPGEPTTTEETLQRAVDRFDEAIAAADGDPGITMAAQVGKARALLNLGRYQEAATAVTGVPTDFSHLVEYSTNTRTQENGVFNFNVIFERWSLADQEAGTGLPFRTERNIPWERTGDDVGFDNATPQYDLLKFPARDAPIPLATGEEARLIEAEAALQSGDVEGMLELLDEVRGRNGVGPAEDPGTPEGRVDLLFRDRAFTLLATSHRLGDLRRLVRQYGRSAAEVFPSGEYFKGGEYGTDVNLPVPFQERNNQNFTGCLDRGA